MWGLGKSKCKNYFETRKSGPSDRADNGIDTMPYKPFLLICINPISATKDLEILSLALKIIGEALLEHIYSKRIKFSICGAINLMKDFDGIAAWIETCPALPANYRDKLAKHEVLKVCEGVGKVRIMTFY